MTIPNQDLKRCSKCKEAKPKTGFYKNGSGYLLAECKKCTIARSKERSQRPEVRKKENEDIRKRRMRIKDAVFAAYGGYKCVCCGETEKLFLSLDHINNDGAKHRKSISGKRTTAGAPFYAWLLRNNFPNGIQVLCMNCQHGKRMNNGVCPHQVRCNDQSKDVELSSSKRIVPFIRLVKGKDMVSSTDESGSGLIKKTG